MKKKELFDLARALNQLADQQHNVKFSYFVAKNRKLIEIEIAALQEMMKPTDDYKVYDEARIDLAQSYAEKLPTGNFKLENNEYVMNPKNREKFLTDIKALKKKHKSAIDAYEKKLKEFDEILDKDETDIQFHKIKMSELPPAITPQQIQTFMDLIEG